MSASWKSVVVRPVNKQRGTYEIHVVFGHLTDVLELLFAAGIIDHGETDMHLLRCGCSWTSPLKGEPRSACADCFGTGWQLHVNDPEVKAAAVRNVARLLREGGIEVEVVHDPFRYSDAVDDDADGSFNLTAKLVYFPGRAELTFTNADAAAGVHQYLEEIGLETSRHDDVLHMATAQTEDVAAVLMHGGSHVTYSYDTSVTRRAPRVEQHTNRATQPMAAIFRAHHTRTGRHGDGLAVVATRSRDTWDALRALNSAGLVTDGSVNVDWVPCGCFCTTLDVTRPDPTCQRCDGLGSEIRVSDCLVPAPDNGVARSTLRSAGFTVLKENPETHVGPALNESWRTSLRGVSLAVRVHPKHKVATVQCELRDRAAYALISALLNDVGLTCRQGEYGLTTAATNAAYVCSALLRVGCTVTFLDPSDPSALSWFVPHQDDAP